MFFKLNYKMQAPLILLFMIADVYFYTLEYSNVVGEQKKLIGYITLIK